jgi:hypothetical protein
MKISVVISLVLLHCISCKTPTLQQPVWINEKDTVIIPESEFIFSTEVNTWRAWLLTATQPVQLTNDYQNKKLVASALHKKGITEGPARICLQSDEQFFFYPVYIINSDTTPVINRDYRSPKTVNPDSSLGQQRIIHQYDINRNIEQTQRGHHFFYENEIRLSPVTATYRAIELEPLTSFYVQPGSCVSIPVSATFNSDKQVYDVIAGPLKDKDGNIVADGTSIAFIYTNGKETSRMEVSLLKGYAQALLPVLQKNGYTLIVRVNKTVSTKITLR